MANYIKATNFTVKDGLPSGNSGKIIKGTEIDTEFTAIADAIASKADTNSPTFTGTPLAPTATAATNTTQVATTAFVQTAVSAATAPLGTMSTQNASSVAITGGTLASVTITNATVNGNSVGANSVGARTIQLVSAGTPTGGNNGDIVYQY